MRMAHERISGDALQAQLERCARKQEAIKARGECAHGWLRPVTYGDGVGPTICNHCGKEFATRADAHAAWDAAMQSQLNRTPKELTQ